MRIQLIVSDDCAPCRVAEPIWRNACDAHGATLEIVDLASPAGAKLSKSLDLRSLPAVLMDGRLVAVGVQNPDQVATLLQSSGSQAGGPPLQD